MSHRFNVHGFVDEQYGHCGVQVTKNCSPRAFFVVDCGEDRTPKYQVARYLDWLAALREKAWFSGGFELLPNPFNNPPEAVVAKGMNAVKAFFEDVAIEKTVFQRRAVKAVIIGAAGSGKTR